MSRGYDPCVRPRYPAVTIVRVDRLLERESELQALMAMVEAVQSGHGAVVLVRGEAGIGKTSLLRALGACAGLPLHVARCESLSVPEPLGPVRELAAAVAAGGMPELAAGDRRALARELQAALTSAGPALAAIEDLHWADPATLDVVRILARRTEAVPIGLILTLRDDEMAANPQLRLLVGDLATDPWVTQIAPRPLSLAAVRSLSEGEIDAAEVARVTGGNPFLVVEVLSARGEMPVTVRDATFARVARLGPAARALVNVAAVVGQRVSPGLLDELAPGQAAAVEEALAFGVLTDGPTTLGVRHELTRRAVEGRCPRRAALPSTRMSRRHLSGVRIRTTRGSPTMRRSLD